MKKTVSSFILSAVLIITASFLINIFILQRTVVSGASMEDNFHDGDQLLVNKLQYHFTDPERFDVIIFKSDGRYLIKRVIGLPGETIKIKDGIIYINKEPLDEDYGKEAIYDAGIAEKDVKLGDDQYFVLGDNRNNSSDSRVFGAVPKSDIVGKYLVRIWKKHAL